MVSKQIGGKTYEDAAREAMACDDDVAPVDASRLDLRTRIIGAFCEGFAMTIGVAVALAIIAALCAWVVR